MDEFIDIWSPEFCYLSSDDDWLNPVPGSYSDYVKNVNLDQWLNSVFSKQKQSIGGTNGRVGENGNRVIDQRTRRIQPSPCRRPGIPNAFETPPDAIISRDVHQSQHVINTNTVTKGVERTTTFTRKQRINESSFVKNATITKARIARRGTFSRGQMPFNSNPFNLNYGGSNDNCDEDDLLTNSHDITYNGNHLNGEPGGVDETGDDNQSNGSPFNDFVNGQFAGVKATSTPQTFRNIQSTNELNRQGTITKRSIMQHPSNNNLSIRPSNGHYGPNGMINGQQSLLNASSAPNLHAARSREQIASANSTYINHGTITKSTSRILTRIPKSNSNSR